MDGATSAEHPTTTYRQFGRDPLMARSFARLYVRIWTDPDWRALDADAQHLYLVLMSQESINMAGVLPLQPRRWAGCVADWDTDRVEAALDRLTDEHFTVVDYDTEEVLVRSLVRNDEAYKTPGMLKSILKSAEHTQAPELRRTLAVELGRLDPLQGKKAEEGMALIAATRLVLMPEGSPPDGGVIHRSDGIGDAIGDGFRTDAIGEPIADTSVSVSVSVPSLSLVGTSVGRGEAPPLSDEPPKCKRHAHLEDGEVPPCPPCGRLRQRWEKAREEAAKPRPLPPLCGECDNRFVPTATGLAYCPRCHPKAVAS